MGKALSTVRLHNDTNYVTAPTAANGRSHYESDRIPRWGSNHWNFTTCWKVNIRSGLYHPDKGDRKRTISARTPWRCNSTNHYSTSHNYRDILEEFQQHDKLKKPSENNNNNNNDNNGDKNINSNKNQNNNNYSKFFDINSNQDQSVQGGSEQNQTNVEQGTSNGQSNSELEKETEAKRRREEIRNNNNNKKRMNDIKNHYDKMASYVKVTSKVSGTNIKSGK